MKINKTIKIKAKKEGNNIIIHKDSFEMILIALCNQKFINELPPNGDALSMGKKKYDKTQKDMQECVDGIYHQCMDILHGGQTAPPHKHLIYNPQ